MTPGWTGYPGVAPTSKFPSRGVHPGVGRDESWENQYQIPLFQKDFFPKREEQNAIFRCLRRSTIHKSTKEVLILSVCFFAGYFKQYFSTVFAAKRRKNERYFWRGRQKLFARPS